MLKNELIWNFCKTRADLCYSCDEMVGLSSHSLWSYVSGIFEMAPKYCISDSFIDCEGYSFSFKEFLPTVVDIMVI